MTTPTGVQSESAENQVTEYAARGDEPTEREPLIGGKLEALSQSQLRRDEEGVQSELAENQVTLLMGTNIKQGTSRGGLEPTTEPDESSVPRPPGSESKSDSSVPREEEKETKVKKFKFKKPN